MVSTDVHNASRHCIQNGRKVISGSMEIIQFATYIFNANKVESSVKCPDKGLKLYIVCFKIYETKLKKLFRCGYVILKVSH